MTYMGAIHRALPLVCLFLFSAPGQLLRAQGAEGVGFWCAFMENRDTSPDNNPGYALTITARRGARVTAEIPGTGWRETLSLGPGASGQIVVPNEHARREGSDITMNNAIRITADDSVRVVATNYLRYSTDAALLLPDQLLGYTYRIISAPPSHANEPSALVIVATANNSRVEITPSVATRDGRPAGQPFEILLNRGQAYQLQAAGGGDLTGTLARAAPGECRPFACFSGNVWTRVGGCQYGNHLWEQLPPADAFGLQFGAVPFAGRAKTLLRLVAALDDTRVIIGGAVATLQAGEHLDRETDEAVFIQADKPVLAAALSTGSACDGEEDRSGDPTLLVLPPLRDAAPGVVSFAGYEDPGLADGYVNVVLRANDAASFRLNGALRPGAFRPLPGGSGYVYASLKIVPGATTLTANGPINATAYAWGDIDAMSFAADYPVSAPSPRINAPVSACVGVPVTFSGESDWPVEEWQWAIGGGEPLQGREITHVFRTGGAYEIVLRVRRAGGCHFETTSHTLTVREMELTAEEVKNVSCAGLQDGAVRLRATGGRPPYQFRKDAENFLPANIYDQLPAGTYRFNARDRNGCASPPVRVVVEEPPALFVDVADYREIRCAGVEDGFIIADAAGGTPPYQFRLNEGAFGDEATFSGLGPGDYYITVRDARQCIARAQVVRIGEGEPLEFTAAKIVPVTCFGRADGAVHLFATGGTPPVRFQINNGGPTTDTAFTGLAAGTYNFVAFDANNCRREISVEVGQPPELVAELFSTTDVTCFGRADGALTLIARGGAPPYVFRLTEDVADPDTVYESTEGSFRLLGGGTYRATITDTNGCEVVLKDLLIAAPETDLRLQAAEVLHIECDGRNFGRVTLAASGGEPDYEFSWSGGNTWWGEGVFDGLGLGRHVFRARDRKGCMDELEITIRELSTIRLTSAIAQEATCADRSDGALTLRASSDAPPITYQLNELPPQDTGYFEGLEGGLYSASIADADSCRLDTVIRVPHPEPLVLGGLEPTEPSCFGAADGSVSVNASGGAPPYEIMLNGEEGPVERDSLKAGDYWLIVTDANGCRLDRQLTITEPPLLAVTFTQVVNPDCFGAATGGLRVLAEGGTPPYRYDWPHAGAPNAPFADGLSAGPYTLVVSDANGCETEADTLLEDPLPVIAGDDVVRCAPDRPDGNIRIELGPGYPEGGVWSGTDVLPDGLFSAPPEAAPRISYAVYAYEGCSDSLQVKLARVDLPDRDAACPHPNYYLPPEPDPAGGRWRSSFDVDPETGRAPLTAATPDPFELYYISPDGCRDTISVTLLDSVTADFASDPPLGEPYPLFEADFTFETLTPNAETMLWSFGDGTYSALPSPRKQYDASGEYEVRLIVTSLAGCGDTLTKTLTIDPAGSLGVPNAFTPNGDGRNDVWRFFATEVAAAEVQIFDRWGNLVFSSKEPDPVWDGTVPGGAPAPQGVYILKMTGAFKDGTAQDFKGTITLTR